jgi:hypothetical protein
MKAQELKAKMRERFDAALNGYTTPVQEHIWRTVVVLIDEVRTETLKEAEAAIPEESVLDPLAYPFEPQWYTTHSESDGWNTCRRATLEALHDLANPSQPQ